MGGKGVIYAVLIRLLLLPDQATCRSSSKDMGATGKTLCGGPNFLRAGGVVGIT